MTVRREKIAFEAGFKFRNNVLTNPIGIKSNGSIPKDGFLQFCIFLDGKQETIKAHRLVAYKKYGDLIFDKTKRVVHKDGNKLNNSTKNIQLIARGGIRKSLEGKKIGRYTVGAGKRENDKTIYLCKCECGVDRWVDHSNLKSGSNQSCGCLQKDNLVARSSKPWEDVLTSQMFSYYKRNAHMRDIPWELSKEEFRKLVFSLCFYCNHVGRTKTKIKWKRRKATDQEQELYHNGVDRFDNKYGYTITNSVPACKSCNMAKNNMQFSEFKEWINDISNFLPSIVEFPDPSKTDKECDTHRKKMAQADKFNECEVCGRSKGRRKKHCSPECLAKSRQIADWDNIDIVEKLKKQTIHQLAAELQCSDGIIYKKLRELEKDKVAA